MTESLRGVYGHDHGLSESPGFNETGLFRLHMNGPDGSCTEREMHFIPLLRILIEMAEFSIEKVPKSGRFNRNSQYTKHAGSCTDTWQAMYISIFCYNLVFVLF